jgi:hypothetical protein
MTSRKNKLFIPPIIADVVYQAMTGIADVQFVDASLCPDCSGQLISHDLKRRRFVTVRGDGGPEQVFVFIKRFHCRECGKLCYADSPFYEKSRFGSPLVDLCLTLSRTCTYSQTSAILEQLGIIIDRGTVRKTVLSHPHDVDSMDLFGFFLPRSIITLSALVMGSDGTTPISGGDVLEACGYPSLQ